MTAKKPLTRAAYREQQQDEITAFEERDQKRVAVERQHAQSQQRKKWQLFKKKIKLDSDEPIEEVEAIDLTNRRQVPLTATEQKIKHLKRRLNWGIFWCGLMIIVIYLILFFV